MEELLSRYSQRDLEAAINLETVLISSGGFSKYCEEVNTSLLFLKGLYASDINNQIDAELKNILCKLAAGKYDITSVHDISTHMCYARMYANSPSILSCSLKDHLHRTHG